MESIPTKPKWSTLTVLAVYLKGLRLVLDEAIEGRKLLVRKLGVLMEDAHTLHRGTLVQSVGRVGLEQVGAFRGIRGRLDRLQIPPQCAACHDAVSKWLDQMVAACDVMVEVGQSGELGRMRETQEHLAESRADARRFNAEYELLLAELRRRARALGKPKRPASGLRRLVRRVKRVAVAGAQPPAPRSSRPNDSGAG